MFGVDKFDVVIANPPYIQLQKNGGKLADLYENKSFEIFDRMGDIYCLFYERGLKLLKDKGFLAFITSNKWMRAGYGKKLRKFLLKYYPYLLIDIGPGVFENATVDTNMLFIQNRDTYKEEQEAKEKEYSLDYYGIKISKEILPTLKESVEENKVKLDYLNNYRKSQRGSVWFIGTEAEQRLKEKIEKIGKPLKDWNAKIYRGVLTGLNEAFIIDSAKRQEILKNCKDDDERKRTEAIIKPILRGRDIKRYSYDWVGLWVIVIPAGWTNKNRKTMPAEEYISRQFPSLMEHLKPFKDKAKRRDDQGDYWWELRPCDYYSEFEKEKIVWTPVNSEYSFAIIPKGMYFNNSVFMITDCPIRYFCSLFNSKLTRYYLTFLFASEEEYTYASKDTMENLPVPPVTQDNQHIVSQIESKVDDILSKKKADPNADTSDIEKEIDELVYQLYGLTDEEIKIVEEGVKESNNQQDVSEEESGEKE